MAEYDPAIPVRIVLSGKFRRYSHLSKLQHITIPSVVFPNIRDVFLVLGGVVQSFFRLLFWRPKVVFLKGGYVCLPVGVAAWLLNIPIVIHDSDAHPGLTNRLLAPLAKRIATGVSLDHYNYPSKKSAYIGIPIDSKYKQLTPTQREAVKKTLGFDSRRPLTVFIGGGLGARQVNDTVMRHRKELQQLTNVVLISGTAHYDELREQVPKNDKHFRLEAFMSHGLPQLLGAADIVVTRAGATALLELAALARPTIVIPSKRLIWQVKHAHLYVDMQAVYPLDEDKFEEPGDKSLVAAIQRVLNDASLRETLSKNLHRLARPNAARDLAATIMSVTRKRR